MSLSIGRASDVLQYRRETSCRKQRPAEEGRSMGRATAVKAEQIRYLQNRMKLLATVTGALEEESSGAEDLDNLLNMMGELEVRIRRFRDDWAVGKP